MICGLPLFEYDHIRPWAEVKHHNVQNLTLLCPDHHAEKTKGLLPLSDLVKANNKPASKSAGHTKPFRLRFAGQECVFRCGDQGVFKGSRKSTGPLLIPILIHGLAPFSVRFEEKHLLLNIVGFDEAGAIQMSIVDSELVMAANNWDVQFIGSRLSVRSGRGKFVIEVEFQPPNEIIIWRYEVSYKGTNFKLCPDDITFSYGGGSKFVLKGPGGMIQAAIGINVGNSPTSGGVGIQLSGAEAV